MKKKEWANAVWLLFHTLAEKLKPEFQSEVETLFSHFNNICYNLPCPDCQSHAVAAMQSANKKVICLSQENLKRFVWEFHNNVNKRINNPIYPYSQLDKYKTANTRNVILNFVNIMSRTVNSEKVMMNNFQRKLYMTKFKEYISANIFKFYP